MKLKVDVREKRLIKLLNALVKQFDKVFFVSERDKGDWNNLHVHMLLDTNTDMTYKEVRYG